MRLSVQHTETFTFKPAIYGTIQVARLTPRDHTGHYVCDWAVEVDADCKLTTQSDAFGNIVTSFSIAESLDGLTIRAHGEVETEQHHGIVRGSRDAVPLGVFLRPTGGDALEMLGRGLLAGVGGAAGTPLDLLHRLKSTLHAACGRAAEKPAESAGQMQAQSGGALAQAGGTQSIDRAAAERLGASLAAHHGCEPADLATILCNAARLANLPARLVSGYRLLDGGREEKPARDIWAEAYVEDLGWIGFDALTDSCPSEETVRVAIGLTPADVEPVRFAHHGHSSEERKTRIAVTRIGG